MMTITFKGTRYTIPYDADTLRITRTIDSTFDTGFVKTVPLSSLVGLDFTKRIPRGLLVEIQIEDTIYEFVTGETSVDKLTYTQDKYVHSINLLSLTKELTKKTLENITLKQPKGDFGIYSRSVNAGIDVEISPTEDNFDTWVDATFTPTANTNTSKTDGMTVVSLEPYKIALSTVIDYSSALDIEVGVRVLYDALVIRTETLVLKGKFLARQTKYQYNATFDHTPSVTGNYSVEFRVASQILNAPFIYFKETSFSITGQTVVLKPVRTYAQLVDKILRNTEFVLSASSRARLFLTAPENKFESNSVYDALSRISGELGALVRVGGTVNKKYWKISPTLTHDIERESLYDANPYDFAIGTILKVGDKYYVNDELEALVREINFEFFDRPNLFTPIGERNRTETAEFEDYVSALELDTKTVIKPIRYSPFKNGWGTLRNLDGIGQMTTGNIGYILDDSIERTVKVLVKGLVSQSASYNWTVDDITDITDRVVDKKQYDTFLSQAIYDIVGKGQYLKNNTLYTVQGDNKIYGMSYTGEFEAILIGTPNVTRALYETILAKRTEEAGELVTRTGTQSNDDPGLPGDLQIQFQIIYENQTESRARVYKKDQSGFETDYIKYMNESANVNETSAIGNYAQELVNRLGGTKVIVDGVVSSLEDIAQLGDVDEEGRVYTAISLEFGKRITYTYTLVKDYNVISSYIGVNSRHRVEEISSESTTNRTLRYISKMIFTDELKSFTTRLVKPENVFKHLVGGELVGLHYGYIEFYHSNGDTRRVHTSIDTDTKGQTIEIKWRMKDNYSAGLKRYSYMSGSNLVHMNSDVNYTDYYGKASDILFSIYDQSSNTYDQNTYPEATTTDGDELFTVITDTIDKDSGEVLGALVEIPIFSENPNIRVYNGFAKFNALLGGTNRIKAVGLNYVPLIKDNKIDLSRVNDITLTGTASFSQIDLSIITTIEHKGIAWYNIDTLDLVLTYIQDLEIGSQTVKLYYCVNDSVYGGGNNITQQIIVENELVGTVVQGTDGRATITEAIISNYEFIKGIDEIVNVQFVSLVVGTPTVTGKNAFVITETIISGIDETTLVQTPIWKNTAFTTFNGTVSLNTGTMDPQTITNSLTALYPPFNYTQGFIMRVRVFTEDLVTLLGTVYRERDLQ